MKIDLLWTRIDPKTEWRGEMRSIASPAKADGSGRVLMGCAIDSLMENRSVISKDPAVSRMNGTIVLL